MEGMRKKGANHNNSDHNNGSNSNGSVNTNPAKEQRPAPSTTAQQTRPGFFPAQPSAAPYGQNPQPSPANRAPQNPQTQPMIPHPAVSQPSNKVRSSVAGSTWVALIVGLLLLIFLLVFIIQNQDNVQLQLFGLSVTFPIGAGMLIAAIIGALIMALVGGVRIIQLRRQVTDRA